MPTDDIDCPGIPTYVNRYDICIYRCFLIYACHANEKAIPIVWGLDGVGPGGIAQGAPSNRIKPQQAFLRLDEA